MAGFPNPVQKRSAIPPVSKNLNNRREHEQNDRENALKTRLVGGIGGSDAASPDQTQSVYLEVAFSAFNKLSPVKASVPPFWPVLTD